MLHGMNNILLSNNCYITISNVYWPVPAINIIYPVGLVVPSSTNVEYLLCPYRTLRRKDDCWHFQGSKLLRLSFNQSSTFNSPLNCLTSHLVCIILSTSILGSNFLCLSAFRGPVTPFQVQHSTAF